MKKKLILLSVVAAMFMSGCKKEAEETQNNETNTNENANNGEWENTNNG